MFKIVEALYLISAEAVLLLSLVFSERLRRRADVICAGLAALLIHVLLIRFGQVREADLHLLSAVMFALTFTMMRWMMISKSFADSSASDDESSPRQAERTFEDGISEAETHDDRLRTLGHMNARLVHEISHPLSALLVRVGELRERAISAADDTSDKNLVSMERQLRHLSHLTESLRMFAALGRREQSGFVPVKEVFEMSVDLIEAWTSDKDVQVSWPDSLPSIEVAGGLTLHTQVLVNLAKNAVDAVAEIPEAAHRWVKIELQESGGLVQIAVSNGGPAVSRRVQTHLFKPFFTTKKTGRGMGLGLALCRELVESAGGEIWYDEKASSPRFVVRYSFLPSIAEESGERAA